MSSIKKLKKQMQTNTQRRQLMLLALASASIQTVVDLKIGIEHRAEIEQAVTQFKRTIRLFPDNAKHGMQKLAIQSAFRRLSPVLDNPETLCSGVTFIGLAQFILEDLSSTLTDVKTKWEMEAAIESLRIVSDLFDKSGDQYQAYEQIDKILAEVYKDKIIGGKYENNNPAGPQHVPD